MNGAPVRPADRLRAAIHERDTGAILEATAELVVMTSAGCWVAPSRRRDGYPRLWVAGRWQPLHRIICAATHGPAPSGVAAHHRCANRGCVRPDHLQWVTSSDNTAEMLERRGYLARIAELEAALAVWEGGSVAHSPRPVAGLGADVVDPVAV